MGKLFQEIQRRKVFRVAALYAVVAWLVIQVAGEILPTFNAPAWVNQTLILILLLGFPITLVIAWAFDLTPEGIKVTPEQSAVPAPQGTGQRITNIMLGLVLLAVGFLVVDQYVLESENGASTADTSASFQTSLSRRSRIDLGLTVPRGGPGTRATIALSEDGARLAYFVVRPGRLGQMYQLEMDQLEPRELPALSEFSGNVFYSPDGQWLAFSTAEGLHRARVSGGTPQLLANSTWPGGQGYWADNDTIFYTTDEGEGKQLMRLSANGGVAESLNIPRDSTIAEHSHAHLLPDGDSLLFSVVPYSGGARRGQVALYSLTTGEFRILIQSAYNARYVPTGHLVFMRSGSLWAVPFDLGSLQTTGAEVPVIQGVETEGGRGGTAFAFSSDGLLVYLPGIDTTGGGSETRTLLWVDREGNEEELGLRRDTRVPVVSPDGERLAAVVLEDNNNDIWTYDLERDIPSRLTFDEASDYYPLWTPDGGSIVFQSSREDGGLWQRAANGTGQVEPVLTGVPDAIPWSFTPDGSQLVYSADADLYILDMTGSTEPQRLTQTGFNETRAIISPDGRWIAYESDESGEFEIYVHPFPDLESGRWQVSNQGGVWPLWHPDGQELYYRIGSTGGANLYSVTLAAEVGFPAEAPRTVFTGGNYRGTGNAGGFDITPDGSRFLFIQGPVASEFNPEFEAQTTQLVVVDNWFEELRQRAPADPQ